MKNKTILPNVYLAIILIIMYLPILVVIIYSFNESKYSSIWAGFSLTWYKTLFNDKDIFEALKNSIILGTLSSAGAGIIGTLGALGSPEIEFKGKGVLEYIATLPIMIPEIILAMGFMAFFGLLGLPFGMTTLVIAHTSFCVPYVYLLVKARLVGLDKSLVEAARDLGANDVRALFDITLPLIFPAILSGMMLAFAMSFDDVVISIFVTGPKVNTLPIKIYTQLKTGVTPEINALCTLTMAVTILFIVLSKLVGRTKNAKRIKEK